MGRPCPAQAGARSPGAGAASRRWGWPGLPPRGHPGDAGAGAGTRSPRSVTIKDCERTVAASRLCCAVRAGGGDRGTGPAGGAGLRAGGRGLPGRARSRSPSGRGGRCRVERSARAPAKARPTALREARAHWRDGERLICIRRHARPAAAPGSVGRARARGGEGGVAAAAAEPSGGCREDGGLGDRAVLSGRGGGGGSQRGRERHVGPGRGRWGDGWGCETPRVRALGRGRVSRCRCGPARPDVPVPRVERSGQPRAAGAGAGALSAALGVLVPRGGCQCLPGLLGQGGSASRWPRDRGGGCVGQETPGWGCPCRPEIPGQWG